MTTEPVAPKPGEFPALRRLVELLDNSTHEALTIIGGRSKADLPESVRELLTQVAETFTSGRALVVLPLDRELTTREAADLLGISRPTLIKLLDAGEIAYSRPNSSRRIPLEHVLAYKQQRSHRRRELLAELTSDAVDMGMYGSPPSDARDVA